MSEFKIGEVVAYMYYWGSLSNPEGVRVHPAIVVDDWVEEFPALTTHHSTNNSTAVLILGPGKCAVRNGCDATAYSWNPQPGDHVELSGNTSRDLARLHIPAHLLPPHLQEIIIKYANERMAWVQKQYASAELLSKIHLVPAHEVEQVRQLTIGEL